MNTFIKVSLMVLVSGMMVFPVQATDSAKEQRWANQLTDFIFEGNPEWLVADGKKFLGLYTPATTDETAGAVILLHCRGAHPDWPQVIQPLRSQLPGKGWATLSLQMPVLAGEANDKDYVALFNEVPARIQAGLDYISQKNINNVVLIGYSLGASMATDYLARQGDERIKAFVGIGMKAIKQPVEYRVLDNADSLQKINLPVLDIYGSKTFDDILYSADRRFDVINRTGHAQSRQIKLEGTGHFYLDHEDKLLENIVLWVNQTTGANKQDEFVVNAEAK